MANVVDVRLARDMRAPALARRSLEVLRPRIHASTFDGLTLLVSELVTNSVQHAGPDPDSWVGIRLRLLRKAVRVEVTDPGPGFVSERQPASLDQTSGRGLYLVGLISDRWGVARDGITRVWFEIGAG
jgi:anti-sigma regulatory factor (Ser/Thr protein kinase)